MTQIKAEKFQWITPDNHSIAVDDQKQPVLNENGDLIVLDNSSKYIIKNKNFLTCIKFYHFEVS